MLLKYSEVEKKTKINGKQQRGTGNMKLIVGSSTLGSRLPRKTVKGFGTKRPASHMRAFPGKDEHRTPVDACDNSNDSGLGFDQHLDVSVQARLRFTERESIWNNEHPEAKRKKLEIKLESDDANDNFSFSQAMNRSHKATLQTRGLVPDCLMPSRGSTNGAGLQRPIGTSTNNSSLGGGGGGNPQRNTPVRPPPRPTPLVGRRPAGPVPLSSQLMGFSRDGKVQLQIASQPEQQHRARYQTEGSRGAVKDRSGNSFPVVKLVGYNKPATLQVFIGTDMGRVAPHMFYQACKVSGKNSTPCAEKKIDGTIVIEVNFDPAKDMTITCDCVGILKERNVDVEHRFPDQTGARNKKKSTRCRMVFRTTITHPDGSTEILQATSQPIVCTQPPGVPEICKKSLCACPCTGGMELFILGKNFLKDTRVVFQQNDIDPVWEETVQPDKEFLQQTHLVCAVPAYQRCDILEPVTVRLLVTSSGKTSEPHTFTYMPVANPVLQAAVGTPDIPQSCLALVSPGVTPASIDLNRPFSKPPLGHPAGLILPAAVPAKVSPPILPNLANQFLPVDPTPIRPKKDIHPARLWTSSNLGVEPSKTEDIKVREDEQNKVLGLKMMPPPPPLLPICAHGNSSNVLIIPDPLPVTEMKTEVLDESSQGSTQLSPEELKGIDLRMKPGTSVVPMATVSDLLSTQSPSLATLRRFVSNPGDAPLPTQSVQSVEKYLSRIENPTTTKGTGESIVTAAVPIATGVTRTADSSAQELTLTKLHSIEKPVGSQFNAPVIFGASQSVGANILSGNLQSSATEPSEKVPFVSEMPMTNIYNSTSIVEKEQQKSQLVEQNTLSNTITSRLLAGLNSVAPGNQTKTEYQEAPLVNLCSSQSGTSLLPSVAESTLPNFHASSVSNSVESTSLNGPSLLAGIAENSSIMETSSSLIFNNNSQPASSEVLLPSTTNPQKSDDQLIDNSNKHASPTSMGVLGNPHNLSMLPTTVAAPSSTSLNIPSSSNGMNGSLLAVPETDQTLMNATSSTRLDVLVSSVIENHILEANRQTQATEKLGVFSASGNLINNMSSEGSVLNSQPQVPLNNELSSIQNNASTSVHVQEMRLNSTIASVSPVNTFTLNSLTTVPPISQENLILSNPVPASYPEHILTSSVTVKNPDALVLNSVNETALALDPPISSSNSPLVLNNPSRTSPIAMKSIILESSSSANENRIGAPPAQNPSISGKNIINATPLTSTDIHLPGPSCTSPIAMKTMILNATSEVVKPQELSTSMNVKDILSPTAINANIALATSASHCTSPIAMKKIILESTVGGEVHHNPSQPPIAIKSVLNSPTTSAVSLMTETVPVGSLSTEKLDALVESTISNHILAPSPVQSTVNSSMNLETSCTATNSLPLTTQSLATILGSNMTPDLTNSSSSLLSQSSNLVSEEQREIHNSSDITLNNNHAGNTASQSQSRAALLTIFPDNSNSISKNPSLQSSSLVSVTCPVLDNHLSGIFGQQSTSAVHSLHPPSQTGVINGSEALQHSPTFSSTNTVPQGLLANTSLGKKLDVTEGQPQSGLYNQVLMNLGVAESGKSSVDTNLNPEKRETENDAKYLVTNVTSKIAERSGVEASSNVAITKLNVVQAVQALQQEPQQQEQGQIKQKEHVVPSSLPVPAPEISPNIQSKETVPIVQGPTQKKLEEGMVPQELTQMSESDLLSYINPSCFDQV